MIVIWLVSMLGAAAGGAIVFFTFETAKGAPQEAAGMAAALAFTVIPYVFARAIEGIVASGWRKEMLEAARAKLPTTSHVPVPTGRVDPTL